MSQFWFGNAPPPCGWARNARLMVRGGRIAAIVMYRLVECLMPDDVQAITALAYCGMLEAGFTRAGAALIACGAGKKKSWPMGATRRSG